MATPSLANTENTGVFHQIIEMIGQASSVLHLSGEEGLGKEAIVRLIYAHSPHRGAPFVKVNCPMLAVPHESELTPCLSQVSPHQNINNYRLFRLFHQGVLYLHSVDGMDMELQGRLLALIDRKLRRKGRSFPFSSDGPKGGLLIFSTSTQPLEACVADGTFDPALYELLSVLSIHIPPLRRSPERIAPLVNYFLKRYILREGRDRYPHLAVSHLSMMKKHRWPGNVKELQEIVKTALQLNNWDSAIDMLTSGKPSANTHCTVDLSADGVPLMPDFEIRQSPVLERLAEKIPAEEMGLMDLVLYEEAMSHHKMS
jgi:DNA-binding NtrC family response regulator